MAQMDVNRHETMGNDILYLLQLWGFEQNHHRESVMQPGQTWAHSDILGLIRFQDARVAVAPPSREYGFFTIALTRWMKARMPFDFACTSISVNKDYACVIHRDAFNAGPSALLALGDFTGGELEYCPEDNRSVSEPRLRTDHAPCDLRRQAQHLPLRWLSGARCYTV